MRQARASAWPRGPRSRRSSRWCRGSAMSWSSIVKAPGGVTACGSSGGRLRRGAAPAELAAIGGHGVARRHPGALGLSHAGASVAADARCPGAGRSRASGRLLSAPDRGAGLRARSARTAPRRAGGRPPRGRRSAGGGRVGRAVAARRARAGRGVRRRETLAGRVVRGARDGARRRRRRQRARRRRGGRGRRRRRDRAALGDGAGKRPST